MAINIRPKETIATFTIAARGTGVAQTARPGGSTHDILVDAVPAFGGNDSAPSPLSYALAALVSCSQVTAQIVAKDLGIRLVQGAPHRPRSTFLSRSGASCRMMERFVASRACERYRQRQVCGSQGSLVHFSLCCQAFPSNCEAIDEEFSEGVTNSVSACAGDR